MAASILPEELHEGFGGIDVGVLESSHDILMSLMEDSQGDEQEFDRLNDFIQSLEAEIHLGATEGLGLGPETTYGPAYDGEDPSDDFSWIDMESVPSSLLQGVNWCTEGLGEFEHVDVHLTEEATYSKLWHELGDGMME
ncbi:hypothetical protein SAY86_028623 [Trapa natans]|uniref:Uncharacterized protein n=1 Tax=Trapa natans TaxID=22666 RepID=A0AAN7MD75_TRANT|nr:hypothetical protein SAY86_028623 [Trapa natans]